MSPSNVQAPANRIVPRYPFEARFKVRIDRPEGLVETDAWARDLSESGVGAFLAAPISLGEIVTLQIPLGAGSEITVPAKVTRLLGTQCGFQFTALSAKQRDQILRAVSGKRAIAYQATMQ